MKPVVSFSFDDGDESIYRNAFHYMREKGIRGTAFITTAWINRPGYLADYQIIELFNNGWEIGSHTHTHGKLNDFDIKKLDYELSHSQEKLENLIGDKTGKTIRIRGFSYPFGGANSIGLRELIEVSRYYDYARINANYEINGKDISGKCINYPPFPTYSLMGKNPYVSGFEDFEANVEELLAQGGWHIFYTHGIDNSTRPDMPEFRKMVDAVHALEVSGELEVLPIIEVLEKHGGHFVRPFSEKNAPQLREWAIYTRYEFMKELKRRMYMFSRKIL